MYLSKIKNGTTVKWDFTYDDNGNLTQKDNSEGDNDKFWFCTYNELNQLTKIEIAETEQGARATTK